MFAKGLAYRDLGAAYLDQIGQRRTVASLQCRLERIGYHVTLQKTTGSGDPETRLKLSPETGWTWHGRRVAQGLGELAIEPAVDGLRPLMKRRRTVGNPEQSRA
jgi:hypothetical protein